MTDGLLLISWIVLAYPSRKELIERVYLKRESGQREQLNCHLHLVTGPDAAHQIILSGVRDLLCAATF